MYFLFTYILILEAPYAPSTVITSTISPISIRIVWTPSRWIAKPELSYYVIRYEKFNNHSHDQHHHGSSDGGDLFHDTDLSEIKTDSGSQLSVVITGLLPFQNYRISISAVNKLRNGTELNGQFSRYVENRTSKLGDQFPFSQNSAFYHFLKRNYLILSTSLCV